MITPVQHLHTLSSAHEILASSCSEVRSRARARSVFASCCLPGQTWERGIHLAYVGRARAVAPHERSALFAIHRRLALVARAAEVPRTDDTAAIFRGLGADGAGLWAVPMVHRTGRLWGELVLVGDDVEIAGVLEVVAHATIALENAQRLAFARRDQDRLLLLAEATSDALYDWDFDTHDFWWGGGIRKLYGSDAHPVENTGRWKLERVHPDDRERVRTAFENARDANEMTWLAEYRFERADGSYIIVEDRGYFLRDVGGRAYRVIGTLRDITELKALIAREQHARSEAENASRAKDEFLAMLGHELRNPLAPIVTGLELLRLRHGDAAKELVVLERQAHHLIRLVDDLLDISRITHGKIALDRQRFEVAAAIAAGIETARPLIEARMHTLAVRVPDRGLEVVADRARLAQAIANLVNNAAKYTEPGGEIVVTAERAGDSIAIRVRDNGIGMEPAMLPHVFHMFVQERQAIDRSQGGLGLGLSIVRSLVELHGGTVTATSKGRGQGSELLIRIPAAPPAVAVAELAVHAPRALAGVGRKIMVVDDNADAADLLSILLEQMGNTTRVAHDAHAALRLAEEFVPDLAVLDIGLPEIDGYELARRLRARTDSSLRLIALTGYGQASDKETARRAGFDAHLVKPIEIDTLAAVIDEVSLA